MMNLFHINTAINENYFQFEMDKNELYENILFPFSNINNVNTSGNQVEINDNFYTNLSLNHVTKVRNILEQIKELKCYGLNHDFIYNIDLIDNNITKVH